MSKNQRVAHISGISYWFIWETIINIWQAAVWSKIYAMVCVTAEALAISTTFPQGEPRYVGHVNSVLPQYGTIRHDSANWCIPFLKIELNVNYKICFSLNWLVLDKFSLTITLLYDQRFLNSSPLQDRCPRGEPIPPSLRFLGRWGVIWKEPLMRRWGLGWGHWPGLLLGQTVKL